MKTADRRGAARSRFLPAAGWIFWHAGAVAAIILLVATVTDAALTPSRDLFPAALLAICYLLISLVLVPAADRVWWILGLWAVVSAIGLTGIYLALRRTGLAMPSATYAPLALTVAVAALVPYLALWWRIGAIAVVAAAGAAAVVSMPSWSTGTIASRAVASALYPLSLRRFSELVAAPEEDGGGLVVLPEGVLLAQGDGVFVWLPGTGGLEGRTALRTAIPAPMDRASYLADFTDPATAPRLRLIDAIFSPGDRPDRLYAAHQAWQRDARCFTMRVSVIGLVWDSNGNPGPAGDWRTLFESEPCQTATGLFDDSETGGALAMDRTGDLILTLGDLGFAGLDGDEGYAQDTTGNSYGKIWRISPDDGAATLVSIGHRNPQGLLVARDGRIWSAEHGPQGGDEVNLIRDGGNYGWPLVTYGTKYGSTTWPLDPDGTDHGRFEEPATSFVPSVAVSSLIEIGGPMFPRWDGDLLLGSLRAQSLYRLRLRDDRVIYTEPIPLGERVRDIAELPDGRIVAWVDTGVLLELSQNSTDNAFRRFCVGCHAPAFGTPAGPPLDDVIGRDIASLPGYGYSPGLAAVEGTWTEAAIDAFLRDPDGFAQGTTMFLAELDAADRQEVIDYLSGSR